MISDSNLSPQEALRQNPNSICPEAILSLQRLVTVEYLGFDDVIHVGQIVVAQEVVAEVETFFRQALEIRFPICKVVPAASPEYGWDDEKLMKDNVSSGFNYRLIVGTENPSRHAEGLAFDINPRQNPYIRYEEGREIVKPKGAVRDKTEPGTLYADHPLVEMMKGFGWEWGGDWAPKSGRVDYQHFEKQAK